MGTKIKTPEVSKPIMWHSYEIIRVFAENWGVRSLILRCQVLLSFCVTTKLSQSCNISDIIFGAWNPEPHWYAIAINICVIWRVHPPCQLLPGILSINHRFLGRQETSMQPFRSEERFQEHPNWRPKPTPKHSKKSRNFKLDHESPWQDLGTSAQPWFARH